MQEVAEMDRVRRYLEGGSFIAGVLIQDTREKMSISEALRTIQAVRSQGTVKFFGTDAVWEVMCY